MPVPARKHKGELSYDKTTYSWSSITVSLCWSGPSRRTSQQVDWGLQRTEWELQRTVRRLQRVDWLLQQTEWRLHRTEWRLQFTAWRLQQTEWGLQHDDWRLQWTAWKLQQTDWKLQRTAWRLPQVDQKLTLMETPSYSGVSTCARLMQDLGDSYDRYQNRRAYCKVG